MFGLGQGYRLGNGASWDDVLVHRVDMLLDPKVRLRFALVDFDGVLVKGWGSSLEVNEGAGVLLGLLLKWCVVPVLWSARGSDLMGEMLSIVGSFPLIEVLELSDVQVGFVGSGKPLVDMVIDDLAVGIAWKDDWESFSLYPVVDVPRLIGQLVDVVLRRGWVDAYGNVVISN